MRRVGFPRLQGLVRAYRSGGSSLIGFLHSELSRFTGKDWDQEDNITLVTVERSKVSMSDQESALLSDAASNNHDRRTLADFTLPSEPGGERKAMEEMAGAVSGLGLPEKTLQRLKIAVAEATMNAMEHGNRYDPEVPVEIQVLASDADLLVRITDQGGSPVPDKTVPDLEAKLEGLQSPRGWGLFLIQSMVDDVRVSGNPNHHTVELVMLLEGGAGGSLLGV